MRATRFGAVLLPELNGVQQLPVGFRSSVIPLRGGGFDQDGLKSYPEPKVLTVTFWVSSQDVLSIDDWIDSIYAEADKGRRTLVATMRDDSSRQAEVKFLQGTTRPNAKVYVPDSLTGLEGYEQFSASFEMVYPYWRNSDDLTLYMDQGWFMDEGLLMDTGNTTTDTITATVTNFTIDNDGSVKHENSTLIITGNTGVTITNVTILNVTTGETITWTGTINVDDVLTINTLAQSILFNGSPAFADTTIPATQLGFWHLALGENDIRITLTSISGGTGTYQYSFARHYIR